MHDLIKVGPRSIRLSSISMVEVKKAEGHVTRVEVHLNGVSAPLAFDLGQSIELLRIFDLLDEARTP